MKMPYLGDKFLRSPHLQNCGRDSVIVILLAYYDKQDIYDTL